MKILIVSLLLIGVCTFANGKVYNKCELARELVSRGIPKEQLRDWLCLVQHESTYSTSARSKRNDNGSYDFGLFQINSIYWCDLWKIGGICKINCNGKLRKISFGNLITFI